MKIKAIITDDGKMYKQIKMDDTAVGQCEGCPFNNPDIECEDNVCPEFGYKWQEVPEITEEEIQSIAYKFSLKGLVSFKLVKDSIIKGANWYKQQLKQRLKE